MYKRTNSTLRNTPSNYEKLTKAKTIATMTEPVAQRSVDERPCFSQRTTCRLKTTQLGRVSLPAPAAFVASSQLKGPCSRRVHRLLAHVFLLQKSDNLLVVRFRGTFP